MGKFDYIITATKRDTENITSLDNIDLFLFFLASTIARRADYDNSVFGQIHFLKMSAEDKMRVVVGLL